MTQVNFTTSHEKSSPPAREKKRVVVAMSGGVDSSVAAALLKEQGFDVIGVSLKLWDYDEDERQLTGKTCCSLDDIADAKDVCDTLGIPFYAFNHKAEFRKSVIDVFVNEYKNGRTPNPCVLCNQSIKFDVLLNEARKMGAYYLATGHYARVYEKNGTHCLAKGKDENKDQSYVLFHLTQDDLKHILFPVGNYTKAEIRALAKRFNLATHSKKESMEICFIPNNDHAAFIAKNYPNQKHGPGNFVDEAGTVLGQHEGIEAFTVGQRRGLGIGFGDRMYVAEIHADRNEVVLAAEDGLYASGLIAERFHFVQDPASRRLGAKIRYQKNEIPVDRVDFDSQTKKIHLSFSERARAITPGQAVVLYDGDEVIGGGWIAQSLR